MKTLHKYLRLKQKRWRFFQRRRDYSWGVEILPRDVRLSPRGVSDLYKLPHAASLTIKIGDEHLRSQISLWHHLSSQQSAVYQPLLASNSQLKFNIVEDALHVTYLPHSKWSGGFLSRLMPVAITTCRSGLCVTFAQLAARGMVRTRFSKPEVQTAILVAVHFSHFHPFTYYTYWLV